MYRILSRCAISPNSHVPPLAATSKVYLLSEPGQVIPYINKLTEGKACVVTSEFSAGVKEQEIYICIVNMMRKADKLTAICEPAV
jgi:hypothetical protein